MSLETAWPEIHHLAHTGDPTDKVAASLHLVTYAFAGQKRRGGIIPMPMAVHSIRVGLQLERFGADLETILAGFCHDLIEDTNITSELLRLLFGEDILQLVEACSLNPAIYDDNHEAGNLDLAARVKAAGPRAVFVKVVDILDNLATYHEVPATWQEEMLWCAAIWLDFGRSQLGGAHAAVKALETQLRNIHPSLGKKGYE